MKFPKPPKPMFGCHIWLFDVGRGFSSVIRTPDRKWVVYDLGAKDDFNPVTDFISHLSLPTYSEQKKRISQLVISHPHNDHLTALKDFDKAFYTDLLTVPNDIDHPQQVYLGKVNWDLLTNQNSEFTDYLRNNMFPGRTPPLKATEKDKSDNFFLKIFYLLPGVCENSEDLDKNNYSNNLSIIMRLNYKGWVVLFCGDMMKDGMAKLIKDDESFRNSLSNIGVDFLIAPHHGLRSAFSTELFNTLKMKPKLNIISEKPTSRDSNEITDDRYGLPQYASGIQARIKGDKENKRKIRTSVVGHIRISLYNFKKPDIVCGPNALKIPTI